MGVIGNLLYAAVNKLPASPFKSMMTAINDSQVLSLLNWFIPFDIVVAMLELWAAAMMSYYGFRLLKNLISMLLSKLFS